MKDDNNGSTALTSGQVDTIDNTTEYSRGLSEPRRKRTRKTEIWRKGDSKNFWRMLQETSKPQRLLKSAPTRIFPTAAQARKVLLRSFLALADLSNFHTVLRIPFQQQHFVTNSAPTIFESPGNVLRTPCVSITLLEHIHESFHGSWFPWLWLTTCATHTHTHALPQTPSINIQRQFMSATA
jgi:hypothetical protein